MNKRTESLFGRRSDTPTVVLTSERQISEGIRDLWSGLLGYEQWLHFAWHEIQQRFRRSLLGPFWITLSMGILVFTLGMVFGGVLNQSSEVLIPYLAIGLIFWGLLTSVITEGSNVFIGAAGYIRDVPLPISAHFYQMITRNMIVWLHNMAIYVVVYVIYIQKISLEFAWVLPGFLIFFANMTWIGLVTGILSTRFRDIPQVISNVIQVAFFATPIVWSISSMPQRPAFVTFNPLYHLLELVRAPLLGEPIPRLSWVVGVGLAIVGWAGTLWLYGRSKSRIAYWI